MAHTTTRALFLAVLAAALLSHRAHAVAADRSGPEPVEVLIMAGDADEAEAQKKFDSIAKRLSQISTPITIPAGYPKLVKSADYKGLKPGFFIMIAGFCPKSASKQALTVLRTIEPGAYVRTVDVDAGVTACPSRTLKDYLQRGYLQAAGGSAKGLAAVYRKNTYGVSKEAEVLLLDANSRVVSSWTDNTKIMETPSNGPESEITERTVQPSGGDYEVRVRQGYINPATNCSVSQTHIYRVGIVNGELAAKKTTVTDDKPLCGE